VAVMVVYVGTVSEVAGPDELRCLWNVQPRCDLHGNWIEDRIVKLTWVVASKDETATAEVHITTLG
jgi:hypothetical protein